MEQNLRVHEYPGLPIHTPRLIVRAMRPADLENLHKLNSDPEVMRYVGRGNVWTREFTEQIIGPIIANSNAHPLDWVAIAPRHSDELIGIICLLRMPEAHRARIGGGPYIELGYRMMWDQWNQGFATEACEAVLDYGFATLKLPEITAIIDERNERSIRVAEKLGFQHLRTYEMDTRHIRFFWMTPDMFHRRAEKAKPRSF